MTFLLRTRLYTFFSSVMHQKADEKTLKHVADLAPMSEEIKPIFSLKYSHCLQRWSYTCHCLRVNTLYRSPRRFVHCPTGHFDIAWANPTTISVSPCVVQSIMASRRRSVTVYQCVYVYLFMFPLIATALFVLYFDASCPTILRRT